MSCIIDTGSKRRLSPKLAAGLALSAFFVLGTFVASASAQPHGDNRGGGGYHGGGGGYHGGGGGYHGGGGGYHGGGRPGGWGGGGGYYPAPPVIYAAPYYPAPYYPAPYYPPPVVYGPAIGIYMPGVSIAVGGQ